MKAVAVFSGQPNSAHLREIPPATLDGISSGGGVLVKVLRVGLDGTDREIDAGDYGRATRGSGFLILGHESFGIVEQVGPEATQLATGDYVVPLVRHPGNSRYDDIVVPDMSTDSKYYEHGISLLHGFLTE